MDRVSLRSVGENCLHCQRALITLHSGKALTRSGVPWSPCFMCRDNSHCSIYTADKHRVDSRSIFGKDVSNMQILA